MAQSYNLTQLVRRLRQEDGKVKASLQNLKRKTCAKINSKKRTGDNAQRYSVCLLRAKP